MKRLVMFTFALMLLTMPSLGEDKKPDYRKEIISNAGRSFVFAPSTRGVWVSSDENVAQVSGRGVINFMTQGKATITFTSVSNKVSVLDVTVGPVGQMPQIIRQGIEFALQEWAAAKGETFPRSNKYTFWLRNAKSSFGWCGAFINFSLEQAGIPMQKGGETTLQTEGNAYSVREAAVSKLWMGFSVMDRVAYIPQPGYLVIYGKSGSTPYIHVGLVTDVAPLGEGRYELKTVEGNINNRILRYNYIYDAYASRVDKNMIRLPENQHSQPDVFRYELHAKGEWYITAFGQTWY